MDLTRAITDGRSSGGAEDVRESKLRLLVSAESAGLARDAAREACALAPASLYLGGEARMRLAAQFRDVARQLGSGGRELQTARGGGGEITYGGQGGVVSGYGSGGGAGDADLLSKVFDAYKEILEAAEEGPEAGGEGDRGCWSREEVERLERMRRVVQPAATRVVGAAAAHEALNTLWREASISVG